MDSGDLANLDQMEEKMAEIDLELQTEEKEAQQAQDQEAQPVVAAVGAGVEEVSISPASFHKSLKSFVRLISPQPNKHDYDVVRDRVRVPDGKVAERLFHSVNTLEVKVWLGSQLHLGDMLFSCGLVPVSS